MSEQLSPAVRIAGVPTRQGTFTVRSATDLDQSWVVEWGSARTHWCGCPAFARSKENTCRHVRAVFDAIALEWEQRRAAEKHERIATR